jgi:hypothetical protein
MCKGFKEICKISKKIHFEKENLFSPNEIRFNAVNISAESCGSQNLVLTVLLGIHYIISQKSASRIEDYSL